ncbi:SPOSA6832_04228, partial [Sporobolomyces salmonicolor]
MDEDPYYGVKAEVESTLATLVSLSSSHSRLLRQTPAAQHSTSAEVQWSLSELKATLAAIEPDVAELHESVEAIEAPGIARRLGIADREVKARRDFVERVKSEISEIARKRLSAASSAYPPSYHTTASYPLEASDAEASDPNAEFEIQHQSVRRPFFVHPLRRMLLILLPLFSHRLQLLREQQDRTLTDISGTVGLLREQAKIIGHELDHHVDSTASRLTKAQRKMDRFIKDNSSSPASWCILVLIVVLSVLLFIIVFL